MPQIKHSLYIVFVIIGICYFSFATYTSCCFTKQTVKIENVPLRVKKLIEEHAVHGVLQSIELTNTDKGLRYIAHIELNDEVLSVRITPLGKYEMAESQPIAMIAQDS